MALKNTFLFNYLLVLLNGLLFIFNKLLFLLPFLLFFLNILLFYLSFFTLLIHYQYRKLCLLQHGRINNSYDTKTFLCSKLFACMYNVWSACRSLSFIYMNFGFNFFINSKQPFTMARLIMIKYKIKTKKIKSENL